VPRGRDGGPRALVGLEVTDGGDRRPGSALELLREPRDEVATVGEDDAPTLGADPAGGVLTDALGGAGDEHDLAGESPGGDERRGGPACRVGHRPTHRRLAPLGVLGDEGAHRLAVTALERLDDPHVVVGDRDCCTRWDIGDVRPRQRSVRF